MISHQNSHRILNADTVSENALISYITIVFFSVKIHTLKAWIFIHVQGERIILSIRAAVSTSIKFNFAPFFSVFPSIKQKFPHRENGFRRCVQPEIYKIEVVCRFMHQKASAVSFVPVPSAEIIGTVASIKQPFKMNGIYVSYSPISYKLSDFCVVRRIPVIECHS